MSKLLYPILFANNHYHLSNHIKTLELDGKQQLALSFFVSSRLHTLGYEIQDQYANSPFPSLLFHASNLCFYGFSLSKSLYTPFVEYYINNHPSSQAAKFASKTLATIDHYGSKVMQQAGPLLTTICLITYVAFLALKKPMAGCIGLLSLALVELKKKQLLPSYMDRQLHNLGYILGLIYLVTTPISLFSSLGFLFLLSNAFPLFAKKFPHLVPSILTTSLPCTFTLSLEHQTQKKIPDLSSLKINPSYIYAKELNDLYPKEEEDPRSMKELFDEIEKKIDLEGIVLSKRHTEGLHRLRKSLVEGFYEDTIPNDLESLQKILKQLLLSILSNEVDFEARVQDLAEVGNYCVSGWMRDIDFLYHPKSKDLAWSLHHHLAKARSNFLIEQIEEIKKTLPINAFQAAGGSNDIHLVQTISRIFRSHFRTYQAEVDHTISPPSLINILYNKYVFSDVSNKETTFSRCARYLFFMAHDTDVPLSVTIPLLNQLPSRLNQHFDQAQALVDLVKEAITPKYIEVRGRLESRADIAWEAVSSWLADAAERRDLDLTDSKWLQQDLQGLSFLTEEGVRLLLWDLGILTIS